MIGRRFLNAEELDWDIDDINSGDEAYPDLVTFMDKAKGRADSNLLAGAIPHIFLPKKTPVVQQPNLEDIELYLVRSFASSVQNVLEQVLFSELDSTKTMLENWVDIQPRTGYPHLMDIFQQQVTELEDGQTLPIYVRNQNATMMVTKRQSITEIATYRSALPRNMVMSTVGNHSLSFPETREAIQRTDILGSQEFANQLYELTVGDIDISLSKTTRGGQEFIETRDVADPRLVTDWIVGLLVPKNEPPLLDLQVQKKIRDQVTFAVRASGTLPFRRSGILQSLKVALQLKVTENLDNNLELGKYVYKLLMLRILTDFSSQFLQQKNEAIDLDLACQISAKIGNRVHKLARFETERLGISADLMTKIRSLKDTCLEYTHSVIKNLNDRMQSTWKTICSENRENVPKASRTGGRRKSARPNLELPKTEKKMSGQHQGEASDLEHEISRLDEFIKFLSIPVLENRRANNKENDPPPVKRYLSSDAIISGSPTYSYYSGGNDRIWLFDTENYIKFVCSPKEDSASVIYEILTRYASQAVKTYENDPVGMSQLALVTLKGLQLLDSMATAKHPELLEYRLDVSTKIFDNILLPYKRDMELLEQLVDYFTARNRGGFRAESCILGGNVDHNSFSVRYAMEDNDMKALRERILVDTETSVQAKYVEIERCRKECNEMQEKINWQGCECQWEYTGRGRWGRRKISTCDRCRLKSTLGNRKKSVERYERPLPSQETYQWAVLFELMVPVEYAIWREYLAFFKFEILGQTVFNGGSRNLPQKWLEYEKIRFYKTRSAPISKLQFGSSSHPTSRSYLSRGQNLDVTIYQNESYIIENGMGCNFVYKPEELVKDLKKVCTFSLENVAGNKPYLNLQDTLSSATHTQNKVISMQYVCDESLTLREFIAYGSVRAGSGHRIQLRNLYEAIYSGNVSLEEESVLALVLQTIWQVGPRNERNERESHLDFVEPAFAEQFVDMLDSLVKTNAANYSSARILLAAVMITRRIGELNGTLSSKIYSVLQQWREIMDKWIKKILGELGNSKVNEVEKSIPSLKQNLLEVLVCSLLSYNISDSSELTQVMQEEKDIVHWLRTIYLLNTEVKTANSGLSTFFKNLLSFAKHMPLRINLEEKVVNDNDFMFKNSFYAFVGTIWPRGNQAIIENLRFSKSGEKCCVVVFEYKDVKQKEEEEEESQRYRLTFDFVEGTFLVNGNSESELPYAVRESTLFQRYFMNSSNLRVRQENATVTTTVLPYRGRHYEFVQCRTAENHRLSRRHYYDSDDDDIGMYSYGSSSRNYYTSSFSSVQTAKVVIKERSPDGSTLVLLDPGYLDGVLSKYFIDNHSHWLDICKMRVLIRPESQTYQDKIMPEDFTLQRLDKGRKFVWKLFNVNTHEYFLNTRSPGFQKVASSLARLELSEYINVTVKSLNEKTAYLRRHNLNFRIKGNGQHESVEYPGFTITTYQHSKETLIGLQHGLLMKNGNRHILLVPHSSIEIGNQISHQNVSISLTTLREPSCFVYEYDDVLKRLKAHNSKTAWLYLAALHASTASPLPDLFTRATGTEMCVSILQSACVWSCMPYEKESKDILNYIKNLSPKRKYYGRSSKNKTTGEEEGQMEVIEWPNALSSMAAYDGLAFIVDKLIEDSERLPALHGKADKGAEEKGRATELKFSEKLAVRAYLRHLSSYNAAVIVQQPKYFRASLVSLMTSSGNTKCLPIRQSLDKLQLANLVLVAAARLGEGVVHPFTSSGLLQKNSLLPFLIQSEPLDCPSMEIRLKDVGSFRDILYFDIRYNWLMLYKMATSCTTQEKVNVFSQILCAVAYRGAPMEQIANLHCISEHVKYGTVFPALSELAVVTSKPETSPSKNVSNLERMRASLLYTESSFEATSEYSDPTANDFNLATVTKILQSCLKPFTEMEKPTRPQGQYSFSVSFGFLNEEYRKKAEEYERQLKEYEAKLKEYETREAAYTARVKSLCGSLSQKMKTMIWPCAKIKDPEVSQLLESRHIESWKAITEIDKLLAVWYKHHKLTLFVNKVQSKLNAVIDAIQAKTQKPIALPKLPEAFTEVRKESEKLKVINLEDLLQVTLGSRHADAKAIYTSGKSNQLDGRGDFTTRRQNLQREINEILEDLFEMVTGNISSKIICKSPIAPRIDPRSTLRYLTEKPNLLSDEILAKRQIISEYVGAVAVLCIHIRQMNRCIRATSQAEVQRETDNPCHSNWSPASIPEWLLLELELDIMIRSVQVEVANQMITMPTDGGNGVTQLNMGEGKTSVIVPMLCSVLAKKDEQLCRVTVLSSMFNMNLTSLTFAMGGLLNRRVYFLPCRRDLLVDEACVNAMEEVYKECLTLQGIVLTLPEYRLSFRLLAYDKILKKDTNLGLKMLGIENRLRNHARDVLDESDELLSVKYQLVYTVGEHLPIDGGDLRWTTCQRILEIVQKLGASLLKTYGTSVWEFEGNATKPHEFSPIRLLNTKFLEEFLNSVADHVLEDVIISEEDRQTVKNFLLKPEVGIIDHVKVLEKIFKETPNVLPKVLIFSGYLRRGVLALALTKRWRVDYGVDAKQGFRRMAVPFRAKDVAAEKTEFGHPDLAIILTLLSYYYSGLNAAQMKETFDILKDEQVPQAIYSAWIAAIPQNQTPKHLRDFNTLNLKDAEQRQELFELLKKHKMVVDFWLAKCVFPRESKQFPGKLVMTAWDLVYERQRYPSTGFSGTNDSQILLPSMISQHDLPKLQKTNENMERTLLQPENKNHRGLRMGVTCKEILELMKTDNLGVLVDAGALMLELSNEQVADLWLSVNPEIEAAVYFSQENHLLVKCRGDSGKGTAFDVSPYQGRLDKCVVFLDDQHTRGTDLKFPVGSKACVTIGARMKREKLMQSCMRMRKLGQGHSVTFYLSHEARDKVDSGESTEITTKSVLEWVCQNTREFNEDGLLYWALAGRNYAQRLAAEDIFHYPLHQQPLQANTAMVEFHTRSEALAGQCVDDEVIKLTDMYGQFTQVELLTDLIPKWFAYAKQKLQNKNRGQQIPSAILQHFDGICEKVRQRCAEKVPNKKHVSSGMMEEEQEKELELEKETEVEEQRQVERPRKAEAVTPFLSDYIREIVVNGQPIQAGQGGVVRFCDVFRGTSFWNKVQPNCWGDKIFASNDFVSVIQETFGYSKTDYHLRPIQYIVSCKSGQLIVLSPYEVNELMPLFRRGGTRGTLHMFSQRRTENQDLLLNVHKLQLPVRKEVVQIPGTSPALAAILLASASLYFINEEEQASYLDLLGLVPQPWTPEQKRANQQRMITRNGFLLPQGRISPHFGFHSDPTELIMKILECRHPVVSEFTHVMRILEKKRKIEFTETENNGNP